MSTADQPQNKAQAIASQVLKKAMKKDPPVFKIRANISVWRADDNSVNRPAILITEECVATVTPNRSDLMSLAKSTVMGKLANFGIDTSKLDWQFETYEFFASRTRDYGGTWLEDLPEWVPAYDPFSQLVDDGKREQAIRELTYLPADLAEQKAIYQA